jgi:hypothetical protein
MTAQTQTEERAFDPTAVCRRAKDLFVKYFSGCDRDTWQIPDDHEPSERAGLEELARHRLVVKKNSGFRLADRGIEVCMGELDLDVVLGLVGEAKKAPVENVQNSLTVMTFNNFGQAGAMGPHSTATANTFQQFRSDGGPHNGCSEDARIQHERDVAAMRRLMSTIHLPSLEEHIRNLPGYLTDAGLHYFEQFQAVFRDGMFDLYDLDLRRNVERLYGAWSTALSEDQYYRPTSNGILYAFHHHPGDPTLNGEAKRAWSKVKAARQEMADARDAILRRMRSAYLEIDVWEMSEQAFADHQAMMKDIDARLNSPRRRL